MKDKQDKPANKRKLIKITIQNFLDNIVHLVIILEVVRAQTHGVQ